MPTFTTTQLVWQLLEPWIGIQQVVRFKFELDVDDEPRITVEYIPDQITAETIAILLKQFKLVPLTDPLSETNNDAETDSYPESADRAG